MREFTKYLKRNDLKNATHLEVNVYYDKGGYSYVDSKPTARGYYISVRPVTLKDIWVSFFPFEGYNKLLFETKRFTKNQLINAEIMAIPFEAVIKKNQNRLNN